MGSAALLSKQEERRLFEAAERRPGAGGRHLVVLQLALLLGLPLRSWRVLRISDVSPDGRSINDRLAPGPGHPHPLCLPEVMRRALVELVEHVSRMSRGEHNARTFAALTPLLSVNGRPLSGRRLREIVQLLRKEAGLGDHVILPLLIKTAKRRRRAKRAPC